MAIVIREKVPVDLLTPRELPVARAIAAGHSHKEIARSLGLSPATIRNYTQRIHERLNVRNNAELATQLRRFTELCQALSMSPLGG